jgi:hypothetical protein
MAIPEITSAALLHHRQYCSQLFILSLSVLQDIFTPPQKHKLGVCQISAMDVHTYGQTRLDEISLGRGKWTDIQ